MRGFRDAYLRQIPPCPPLAKGGMEPIHRKLHDPRSSAQGHVVFPCKPDESQRLSRLGGAPPPWSPTRRLCAAPSAEWRHAAMLGGLVEPGRNYPSLYTVNGRPLYVHLNGLAIVLLK